ncbi:MAG: c-type cytochrome domain-containing protein [Alphaproteobacteria bacterium]
MRLKRLVIAGVAAAGAGLFGWAATAQTTTTWGDVSSIFADNCTRCHASGGRAGLNLSNYATTIAGSNNGPVLVSGNPSDSLLVKRIRGEITPRMPLNAAALSAEQIALSEDWITDGLME